MITITLAAAVHAGVGVAGVSIATWWNRVEPVDGGERDGDHADRAAVFYGAEDVHSGHCDDGDEGVKMRG
jgi:hypothetical protein